MNTACSAPANPNNEDVMTAIKVWLERAVIGLNLCPFAKSVYVKNQIRYVVSTSRDTDTLALEFEKELQLLKESDAEEIDTTLLIVPHMLHDFFDYNDFLDVADMQIDISGLRGEIQIASFHPDYQFADTDRDDIANFTNRAPYPILHLLRESSIDRAVSAFPEPESIFEKNIATMEALGVHGWQQLFSAVNQQK
ncbi:MAG: DUF1415 domain-containing protein [Oxalicibacterium faecigallinarum]|nr:DUF1415 domain-containing protein [Oxalicibacterium faecigallinarum]